MSLFPTPGILENVGRAIYGENWRAPMARRLGKSKRTIERYAAGSRRMPPDMLAALEDIIDEQVNALMECRGTISSGGVQTATNRLRGEGYFP